MMQYLIVGNGRLAQHLRFYLETLSIPYLAWHRGANSAAELLDFAETANRIILAISDKAIEPFILAHPEIPKSKWLHMSGALSIPGIYAAHPLGSFGEKPNPASWYRDIFFVVEKQGTLPQIAFSELLPGLPNAHAEIQAHDKPYYHSLCVLSNNFSTILFQKLFTGLEQELNIPKAAAYSYLRQTVFNLEHTARPLTGPLARNDKDTIRKNIEALQNRQDNFADIYEAFVDLAQKLNLNK